MRRSFGETALRLLLLGVVRLLFRVRVTGGEKIPSTGGALLVANHISYADSVVIGSATPRIPRFLIWEPIYATPLVRPFFDVLGAIPVALESPKKTIRALQAARAQIERGQLVAIFPEGQISLTGELQAFERGFERIVSETGAPIIPIHIDGLYGHPISRKGGEVFRSWEKLWRPIVTVRVGNPICRPVSAAELQQIVAQLQGIQD